MQQELAGTQLKLAISDSKLADIMEKVESTQEEQLKLEQQLELVILQNNNHLVNVFSQINMLMVALHHSAVTNGHNDATRSVISSV